MKLLKNKFFYFLILFFVLFFSNVCLAVDFTYNISEIQEVKDGFNYCLIELENGNKYLLCCNSSTYNYLCFNNEETGQVILSCKESCSNWDIGTLSVYHFNNSLNTFDFVETIGWGDRKYKPIKQVIGSSCDIKYMNNSSEIFFQKTPVPLIKVTVGVLEGIQEIPQVIMKVVQLIIPIGLVIFGILLLVLLIRWVILRVI